MRVNAVSTPTADVLGEPEHGNMPGEDDEGLPDRGSTRTIGTDRAGGYQ